MRSVRPQNFNRRPQPRYGDKGVVAIQYTGEIPYEYRGIYTERNYVWHGNWPDTWPKWMDKRDVPGLVKAVGLDKLEGEPIDKIRAQRAEKARKRKAKKTASETKKQAGGEA